MNKKVYFILLFFLFIKVNAYSFNKLDYYSNENKNPLWDEYISNSNNSDGAIMNEYVVLNEKKDSVFNEFNDVKRAFNNTIPSNYNLVDLGYVSPIKDQGNLGLCWAYAINSSLESNLLMKGMSTSDNLITFSERHLDYLLSDGSSHTTMLNTYKFSIFKDINYNPYAAKFVDNFGSYYRELGSGGRFDVSTIVLSNGIAGVNQGNENVWKEHFEGSRNNESSFNSKEVIDYNYATNYSVTDLTEFPYINMWTASDSEKKTYRNYIKKHIMNYGAVYVSTVGQKQSNSGSCSYLYNDSKYGNTYLINWRGSGTSSLCGQNNLSFHAMSIVGWDDNYELSYCVSGNSAFATNGNGTCNSGTLVNVKGAWILKNSWGTQYSNSYPYLYLAYDSNIDEAAGINNVIEKDFDNAYDELMSLVYYNYDSSSSTLIKKYKKSSNTEILKRVSILHESTSSSKFSIYVDGGSGYKQVGSTYSHPGYTYGMFSVSPTSQIKLTSDTVSVKIVGAKADKVIHVSLFTDDLVESTTKEASLNVYDDTLYEDGNYLEFTYGLNLENYDTGTPLTYSFRNSNGGNNPSSYFSLEGYSNIFNESTSGIIKYDKRYIPYGEYDFVILSNGSELVSKSFQIRPSVNVNKLSISVGQKNNITYVDNSTNSVYTPSISYYSEDPSVAVVNSSTGEVTGVSIGSTKIGINYNINGKVYNYTNDVEVLAYGFDNYKIVDDNIYILPEKNDSNFIDDTVHLSGSYSLDYEYSGNYIGTGSKLKVLKNGSLEKEYTVIVKGDTNSDGKIGIGDVARAYAHFTGSARINDAYQLEACDTNGDGKIGIGDVSKLYSYFTGNISSF